MILFHLQQFAQELNHGALAIVRQDYKTGVERIRSAMERHLPAVDSRTAVPANGNAPDFVERMQVVPQIASPSSMQWQSQDSFLFPFMIAQEGDNEGEGIVLLEITKEPHNSCVPWLRTTWR